MARAFSLLLLLAVVLSVAHGFSSAPALALRHSSTAAISPRAGRYTAVTMQEDPPKQTTGFGKLFKGLTGELTAETRQVDETGKRTLKATPAQIMVLVIAQFGIPIALIQIYKAVKGGG
eukprot:CAMPEP_0181324984 /NCGR_PEP_ID=MMETSP1101-20121128/20666_1 /TAXON_ID=46948 /ORGANISM="Rhodomonas abbreviata, Strain Caron Lab Isolate" /LENGTH=118 /DNA_ID=CAMNT_0023433227 /DNA_START=9 /DNA_END=365 /DNA_ORIENTATION=+